MLVKDLIKLLRTFPQDIPVCYKLYSEQCLLDANEVSVKEFCHARPDGWVQNKRPDMPSTPYLVLPGN